MGFLGKFLKSLLLLGVFYYAIISGLGLTGAIILEGLISLVLVALAFRSLKKEKPSYEEHMGLGRFLSLLFLVALVAIIYSPSAIQIPVGQVEGTTSPFDYSPSGTSVFLDTLRQSGYTVSVTNNTYQLSQRLASIEPMALLLIGPDLAFRGDMETIKSRYDSGTLSLLVAQGNKTNNYLLGRLFNAQVSGAAIRDPNSTFHNPAVFTVTAEIGSEMVPVVMDVASPITLRSSSLWPAAVTGPFSFDTQNSTIPGPKTVVAMGQSGPCTVNPSAPCSHSALVSDSAPFTNYSQSSTQIADMERTFATKLVDWITGSSRNINLVYDNSHYRTSSALGVGIRVGPLFAYGLELYLSLADRSYRGFISGLSDYGRLGFALLLASSVYFTLAKKYAPERRGRDDEPVPVIEKLVVAESRQRRDFLKTYRDEGFYIATLADLYEVLDRIFVQELAIPIVLLKLDQLKARLGDEDGARAARLFSKLSKIHEYANGERRFLLPPILRWKRTLSKRSHEAEQVLNKLGLTMSGKAKSKVPLEYKLRR